MEANRRLFEVTWTGATYRPADHLYATTARDARRTVARNHGRDIATNPGLRFKVRPVSVAA